MHSVRGRLSFMRVKARNFPGTAEELGMNADPGSWSMF